MDQRHRQRSNLDHRNRNNPIMATNSDDKNLRNQKFASSSFKMQFKSLIFVIITSIILLCKCEFCYGQRYLPATPTQPCNQQLSDWPDDVTDIDGGDINFPMSSSNQEPCCACDEAKYEVIFEGLWSKFTHPKDFPSNVWLTHFSDIIGASHSSDFKMWEKQGYATEGLQEVVELGITKKLEAELKNESNKIRTIIKARGLWHPNLNGKTFAVFRVDKRHNLMSLVSKLGPSPDWFVGVNSLNLCLRNCSWVSEIVLPLSLWDAGTDAGKTYTSAKETLNNHDRIQRVRPSADPNMTDSPFYDPSGARMNPFARLTITRQRMYEKACDDKEGGDSDGTGSMGGGSRNNNLGNEDNDEERPECMTNDWSEWSPCSATCAQGVRMRTRNYLSPSKARYAGCSVTLIEKEICETECVGEVSCATTPWSEWSECSVSCGKGYRTRTRLFDNRLARKVCSQVDLVEKEPCFGLLAECPENSLEEDIDPKCMVTQWSEWSPCTASCGKGIKARTRLYINPNSYGICDVELMQKMPCLADKPDCTLDIADSKEICSQPKEVGPCRGYFPRWYFDSSKGICLQFIYGGCRGNKNNFEHFEECNRMCQINSEGGMGSSSAPVYVRAPLPDSPYIAYEAKYATLHVDQGFVCASVNSLIPLSSGQLRNERNMPSETSSSTHHFRVNGLNEPTVDCVVTPWGPWSECSRPCGRAQRSRRRMIKLQPQNGGKDCPTKLVQRRRCKDNPPCPSDCILSEWGEWSDCSVSCGIGGIKYRMRDIVSEAKYGGAGCGPKIERTYCSNLPPCPDNSLQQEPSTPSP